MVKNDISVYLFIGQDPLAKDALLAKLKKEFLSPKTEDFNFDLLYGKELGLADLQEKLLAIPLKAKKRIIVIKDIQRLNTQNKEFLLHYLKKPYSSVILVLDLESMDAKDDFLRAVLAYAQVSRFKEAAAKADTFALNRQIDLRKAETALRLVNQLLKEGEKPERIMGALRYIWERNSLSNIETKRKLKMLLNCDIDIKTGRLKADFALEKLVIKLCSLPKPFS